MTQRQKLAMAALAGLLVVLGVAVGTGTFDGVLRQFAGTPPPADEAGRTDVAATPVGEAAPGDAAIAARVVPVFDLVRVEPSGDAVIAGQGTPNAEVEVLSGDDVIATGKVNGAGEWAIVLTDPLKAGAHDIKVRTRDAGGGTVTSEQSVAVSVPEGGNGEVLVVLNQPGTPSTVLQIPGEAEAEAAVAAAAEGAPAAELAAAPAPDAAAPAEPPAPDAAAPVAGAEVAVAAAPAEGQPASPPAEPAAPDQAGEPPAQEPAVASGTAAETPEAAAEVVAAAPAPAETVAETPAVTATAETPAVAAPAETPAAAAPAETAGQPSDAAPPDAAAAPPAETAPGAEVAALPAAEPSEPAPAEAFSPAVPVTVEAVELENGERFFAAGAAEAGAVVRLYVDDSLAAEIRAMPSGRWLVDTDLKLDPGRHTVRADQIAPDGTVIARAEVPFEIAEDLAAAPSTVSGSGSVAAGSGTAGEARIGDAETLIIRQGDNLWSIARRLYGRGVRYSTIYQANSDQIVDPDLIYPGQVFVIPQGDRAWEAEEQGAAPAAAPQTVTQ